MNNNPLYHAYSHQNFICNRCQEQFTNQTLYSVVSNPAKISYYSTYCWACAAHYYKLNRHKNMPNIIPKNVKPTTKKVVKPKKAVKKTVAKPVKKPTKTKKLTQPRPVRPKQQTLSYYHCLIDQIANPVNEKVKITKLSSHCRCNKNKVAAARQEHKQQLVKELAKSYQAFGQNLGHYLQADIVGCAKELEKK